MAVADFKHLPRAKSAISSKLARGRLVTRLLRAYALRPAINRERCIGCGICARSCPQQVIRISRGKARIKYGRCIRCYCCHEMCQEKAIGLERSRSGRFIARLMEDRKARS